jgi:c-di-GMP-binding flagellar brake protein YcgR
MASTEQLLHPPPQGAHAASAETVLEPARIFGILSAITFPPLLVNVALPGVRGLFTSALLRVDSTAGEILLDALNPDEGHAMVGPGSVMHVHGKLKGVQVDFPTRVIEIQSREHLPAYLARLPASVRYHQRRRHFRLRAGHLRDYSVVTLGPEAGGLRGRLLDVSAGGLKGIFPRDPGLTPGRIVDGCSVSVLGEQQLECSIELAHARISPLTGEIEAGARFLGTDARTRERLQRLLTKLQRQQLRHRIPE